MKQILISTFISFCFPLIISAQRSTEAFQLDPPEQKIQNSLYGSISCIDARLDTSSVGLIQRGALNHWVKLVTGQSLKQQTESAFKALTDSTAKTGELVLIVRQFSMIELDAGLSGQKAYCAMRANLFARKNGSYQLLSSYDSVVKVRSPYDVTKDLLKTGSNMLTGFIAGNLLNKPAGRENFSIADIHRIDSFEKKDLPVYQTNVYKDGVYRSFRSFIDQNPDGQITARVRKGKIEDIFVYNKKGKKEKVWQKDTYAVIYNGVPYISTEFDYYPLIKRDGDFYFTGKARAPVLSADAIFFSVLITAFVIWPDIIFNGEVTFEMKIDHLTGGFIRLNRVRK